MAISLHDSPLLLSHGGVRLKQRLKPELRLWRGGACLRPRPMPRQALQPSPGGVRQRQRQRLRLVLRLLPGGATLRLRLKQAFLCNHGGAMLKLRLRLRPVLPCEHGGEQRPQRGKVFQPSPGSADLGSRLDATDRSVIGALGELKSAHNEVPSAIQLLHKMDALFPSYQPRTQSLQFSQSFPSVKALIPLPLFLTSVAQCLESTSSTYDDHFIITILTLPFIK